jgi:hypothetical protein
MRDFRQRLEAQADRSHSTLAKSLAPEEIRPGDFVAILHVVCELPSFLWCADASTLPLGEPVRVQFAPEHGGVPLKVKSVCLPFVLVKSPFGDTRSLDVRRYRLARLDKSYATTAWKAHKTARSRRKCEWLAT